MTFTGAQFMRGTRIMTISADADFFPEMFGAHTVTATLPGLSIKLPDARTQQLGGIKTEVWNAGAEAFDIRNFVGAILATVNPGEWATVCQTARTASGGQWAIHVGAAGFAAEPAPAFRMYFFRPGAARNMYEYNQAGDAWTTKSQSPTDQIHASGTVFAGAAHFFSDTINEGLVQKYDPDVWSAGTTMPSPNASSSANACAGTLGGLGYSFGDAHTTDDKDAWEYDGSTWTQRLDRSSTRAWTYHLSNQQGRDIGNATMYLMSGGNSVDEGHAFVDSYVLDTYTARTERAQPWKHGETSFRNDSAGEIFTMCGEIGSGGIATGSAHKYSTVGDAHAVASTFPDEALDLMPASLGTLAWLCFYRDQDLDKISVNREFDMITQTYSLRTSGIAITTHVEVQNQSLAIPV